MRLLKRNRLTMKPDETTTYRPDAAQESLQRRIAYIGVVVAIAFGILLVRLWFMQIVSGEDYRAEAEGNRIRKIPLDAARGQILDRNGNVIVRNRSALTISVVPTEFNEQKEVVITRLSRLLSMGKKEIEQKIINGGMTSSNIIIKSDVNEEIIAFVREHRSDFPGVIAGTTPVREYPHGVLAAHLIGYLGEISPETLEKKKDDGYQAGDKIGLSGVEATYDDELRGVDGYYKLEVDAQGNSVREVARQEARAGANLKLTIDQNIQSLVEDALKAGVELSRSRRWLEATEVEDIFYKATGASAVVIDPDNGEIIAMASYPSFNLNDFVGGISEEDWEALTDPENLYPLNNKAIMSELAPGSTFKVITALSALEEGLVTTESTWFCNHVFNEGEFKDFPKTCWSTHHGVGFLGALAESCDIAFYHMGYDFYKRQSEAGAKNLWQYAEDWKLGKLAGIDLPSEQGGRVPNPRWKKEFNAQNPEYQAWYPGDTVNMAIGQGDILATPLQMANVFAVIANGGTIYRPHVVKSFEDHDGDLVKEVKVETNATLKIDPEYMVAVREALKNVITGGTASATFSGFPIGQVSVAGKTGTSEVAGKQPTAWFCCYAPAEEPKYVISIAIEQGGHGGEVAAPVARRILEGIFQIPSAGVLQPSLGD